MEDRTSQLRRTPLFSALSDADIRLVAELLRQRSYRRRSTIYRQGQLDTTFYVVVSGRLRVSVRDERGKERILNYLQAGDSFGEHSLLTGARRDVTMEVEENAVLLLLEKSGFDGLLAQYPHLREALGVHKLERLRKTPLFEKLSTEDLHRIAAVTGRTRYREGSVICRQGELGTAFYIIQSGRVVLQDRDEKGQERVITHLHDGDFFGGSSLRTGEPRENTVQALEDTSLFYLNKRDLNRLVREYPSIGKALKVEAGARELLLTHRFPWQREDEALVALSYKHVYGFLRRLWLLMFPLLALGGVLALAHSVNWSDISLYVVCTLIGISALLIIIWYFVDWRNDYYVVTNKRVIHVEKIILLRETRDEAPLENIQDVSILIPGAVARLLGFGDLSIRTAGSTGGVVFKTLGNPSWVRDRIFDQLEQIRAEERVEEREAIRHKLELELGQVKQEVSRMAESEPVPLATEPEVSSVTEAEKTPLPDLLRGLLDSLVPRMRLEEDGIVIWRKHWFRLIEKTVAPLLLMFILVQLGIATSLDLLSPLPRFGNCLAVALLVGLFVGSFLLWYRYDDWRNDIYQLTDDRIVDIEKLPLGLREERREASLAMIQDIRYVIPGPVATLLDYGNVVIETAASEAVFTFDWVHQPRRVQEEIFARMDALREKEKQRERQRRTAELLDWFATYSDLTEEQKRPEEKGGE